jgi:hypothetical protein
MVLVWGRLAELSQVMNTGVLRETSALTAPRTFFSALLAPSFILDHTKPRPLTFKLLLHVFRRSYSRTTCIGHKTHSIRLSTVPPTPRIWQSLLLHFGAILTHTELYQK